MCSALMLRLPDGLLSSSMPVFTTSAPVRRRCLCLLFDSELISPRRLVFPKPKCLTQLCEGARHPLMATTLVLLVTLRNMAPPLLRVLCNRLMNVSPMARLTMILFPLGRLRLVTRWNSADPLVLPGLTTLMTVFGGMSKDRLLTSSWLLKFPEIFPNLTIRPLRCLFGGTQTLPALPCPRHLRVPSLLKCVRCVPDPDRWFPVPRWIYLSLCLTVPR